MKLSKRKEAINIACITYENLCKYRGIPCDVETGFYIGRNWTLAQINSVTESFLFSLNEPLQPATEKQMNYILSLAKEWKDEHLFKDVQLNKYQASELIKIYKEANELLYSHYPIANCNETWVEIDRKIEKILELARK